MSKAINLKWHVAHQPEDVWQCLTDSELIAQWLMENDFKPQVGHRFRFHTKPIPKMGFDGIVYCEVLEVVPVQKLVYSWKGGPRPGVIQLDTILTWTLEPIATGTVIHLEHKGFEGFKNYIASVFMDHGWKKKIQKRFGEILDSLANGVSKS